MNYRGLKRHDHCLLRAFGDDKDGDKHHSSEHPTCLKQCTKHLIFSFKERSIFSLFYKLGSEHLNNLSKMTLLAIKLSPDSLCLITSICSLDKDRWWEIPQEEQYRHMTINIQNTCMLKYICGMNYSVSIFFVLWEW